MTERQPSRPSADPPPAQPQRGDPGAYARYLQGMDASMAQKVALTAAHLLFEGEVADLGMGSGAQSDALAALYPLLEVVGVDLDPEMVALARQRYQRANLRFVVGDISQPCFEPGSLDGVIASSVLHHVTTFSGYRREMARQTLAVQATQLRDHGVLVVRDFVDPGPGQVWLDLPADDGDGGDDPRTCSTAALLERFAREFRKLIQPPRRPGFPCRVVPATPECPVRPGWRRYELSHTLAAEFVLRKDYRESWDKEVLEEYTFATQAELEGIFAELGLRVLASTPLRNPWIVSHRFQAKLELRDAGGRHLPFPATNTLIAGERVPAGEGVRFAEGPPHAPLDYLILEAHRHRTRGDVYDLARRPHLTVDVLPWFDLDGASYVLTRHGYPRPILAVDRRGSASLDGSRAGHYVTEPLTVLLRDEPLGQTVEAALEALAGVTPAEIRALRAGSRYYPSPGGIEEEVQSVWVEVAPTFVRVPHAATSGFSTSGRVRAIEARQLLRASQVGGMPDVRLEINVYGLLRHLGRDCGPWIGESIDVPEAVPPAEVTHLDAWMARPGRRAFARAGPAESTGFLTRCCAELHELDAAGQRVAVRPLEWVVPSQVSTNTVAVALLCRAGEALYLGCDDDDLPAAQQFTGSSRILVAPAWRLPRQVDDLDAARAFALERIAGEYGLRVLACWGLGAPYHPTPGLTPEVVHPLGVAVEPRAAGNDARPLAWIPLAEVVAGGAGLPDGHLRVVSLRAAHALGVG